MGLKIYGIGAAQNPDNIGETILLDGMDISKLHGIKDEHDDDSFFRRIGGITFSKKIYSEKDCEDEKQLRCWKSAQVPFLYAEAELADDSGHPNAESAASLLKFCQRPDVPLSIGFSVDGNIVERKDRAGRPTEDKEEGKTLAHTIALDLSLTVKPCNPKCRVFLENDLAKSVMTMNPPKRYFEALKKSEAKSSFNQLNDPVIQLYNKLYKLKKSVSSMFGDFTDIKCHRCGNPTRFFKSDTPNACHKCGSSYSVSQIFRSLNKKN